MRTKVITIGNSRGIRIPRLLLEQSRLGKDVELTVKRGEIRIVPLKFQSNPVSDTALASENVLAEDWNRPEEEIAWTNL